MPSLATARTATSKTRLSLARRIATRVERRRRRRKALNFGGKCRHYYLFGGEDIERGASGVRYL